MKACIITIGNEILKGKTVNTNAAEIGRMLYFSGYDVFRGITVSDEKKEIGTAFRSLVGACDVIVSSGGLGPTFDDMTISSFAEEFGIRLVLDRGTYDEIKERAEERGLNMTQEREKMALVPEGSRVIANKVGSAPGIEYSIGKTRIFILPGVPAEMRSMLGEISEKIKLADSFYFEDSIMVRGIYEASLSPFIKQLMDKYNGRVYIKSHPTVTPETGESLLEVEVSAKSDKIESSSNIVKEVLKEISELAEKLKSRQSSARP